MALVKDAGTMVERPREKARILEVDGLIAGYILLLEVVWLKLVGRTPLAWVAAVAHLLALIFVLFVVPVFAFWKPRGLWRALREGYPFLALGVFWAELGVVQRLRDLPPHDDVIRALDLALFRVHLSDVWIARMPYPALQELMFFGYFLYYALLVVPPIAIGVVGGWKAFRSVAIAVMLTYLSLFAVYIAYPVYGPRAMGYWTSPIPTAGFFQHLVERARESGDSLGTAFPSSHVAGAVTMAWMAWRWLGRRWGLVLGAAALWVALATVYTRNHYLIDAVIGALWVIPLQVWVQPRLEWQDARKPHSV